MRTILIALFFSIATTSLYGQTFKNDEFVCVENLYLDVQAWVQIQQERRDLTNYDESKATPDEAVEDLKNSLDGFLSTIDTSQLQNCPGELSEIAGQTIRCAKQLNNALVKAIDISLRVKKGKSIPQQELETVDKELTQSLANWEKIIPKFDSELSLQYSLVKQGR